MPQVGNKKFPYTAKGKAAAKKAAAKKRCQPSANLLLVIIHAAINVLCISSFFVGLLLVGNNVSLPKTQKGHTLKKSNA